MPGTFIFGTASRRSGAEQNDLIHVWGLHLARRICAERPHEKIGVADAQSIERRVLPSYKIRPGAFERLPVLPLHFLSLSLRSHHHAIASSNCDRRRLYPSLSPSLPIIRCIFLIGYCALLFRVSCRLQRLIRLLLRFGVPPVCGIEASSERSYFLLWLSLQLLSGCTWNYCVIFHGLKQDLQVEVNKIYPNIPTKVVNEEQHSLSIAEMQGKRSYVVNFGWITLTRAGMQKYRACDV